METAFVNIWGRRVGAVAWDASSRTGAFEYEPSFLRDGWELSPLMMPLNKGSRRIFSFPELRYSESFKGLPGLIADSLPDRYGNEIINNWLSRRGRPSNSLNPVEMLCFIGKRGMGAIEYEPNEPRISDKSVKIEIDELVKIANDILTGREDFKTNISENEEKALLDILKISTSAGGARAKAVIAYNPVSGEVRSGQLLAPKGFTHWLIKFDGVADNQFGSSSGYGRVEMAYYRMAVDAGIEMMESRLLEENGRAHFMTRRFDREPGKEKIHMQSFCAMQHYDFNNVNLYSYEQLFETMRMLSLHYTAAEQLFRRMVFNVTARNCDDHTKNFAFTLEKGGEWLLSPAFDICHSYRPGSTWVSQQSLSVNGKRKLITHDDFLIVAKQMNIKKAPGIIDHVTAVVKNWKAYAHEAGVEPGLQVSIGKTLLV